MARLDLTLLGGFQARLQPGAALALPIRKAQALLAYLAVPLGQAHPRGKLAALLWGETREDSARASLRQALFAIRKAVGETNLPAIVLEGETLALDPSAVDVDVAAFERLMADGTPLAKPARNGAAAVPALRIRAPAGARAGARGEDEAALSGNPPPAPDHMGLARPERRDTCRRGRGRPSPLGHSSGRGVLIGRAAEVQSLGEALTSLKTVCRDGRGTGLVRNASPVQPGTQGDRR